MRINLKRAALLFSLAACLIVSYGCPIPEPQPGTEPGTGTSSDEQVSETEHERRPQFAPRQPRSDDEGGKKIVYTEDQAVELGVGFDSDSGEFLTDKKCVLFVPAKKGGRQATMSIRQVTDNHSLSKALNVSASAEVKAVLGSGKGKASFASNVDINSSFVSVAVHAQVEDTQRYARGVPTDEAVRDRFFQQLAEADDPEPAYAATSVASGSAILLTDSSRRLARDSQNAFLDQCGDAFVSSLFLGVELGGVLTLESHDEQEKQDFSAAIEAQGPWWKAEASVNHSMNEFSSSQKLKVNYHETGQSDDPLPASAAELMQRAQDVKKLLADPRLYKVAVTPYSRLANWPRDEELELEDSTAGRLLYSYSAYREVFDLALEMLAEPGEYDFATPAAGEGESSQKFQHLVTEESLRGVQDELQEILRELRALIEDCDDQGWDEQCEEWLAQVEELRSPYYYRAQLAAPGDGIDSANVTDLATFRDQLAGTLLRGYRDRACRFSPDYPACISNEELREYELQIPVRGAVTQ